MLKNLLFVMTASLSLAMLVIYPVRSISDSKIYGTIYSGPDSMALKAKKMDLLDSNGILVKSIFSDSLGFFEFDSLSQGRYTIRWEQHGLVVKENLVLVSGEDKEMKLVPATTEVHAADSTKADVVELNDDFSETDVFYGFAPAVVSHDAVEKMTSFAPEGKKTSPISFRSRGTMEIMHEEETVDKDPGMAAGTLTAGEINDFAKWKLWEDLTEREFSNYQETWKLYLKKRYPVQVTFENGIPAVDAEVKLVNKKNEVVFIARTDNTGRAELWADMVPGTMDESDKYQARVSWNGTDFPFKKVKPFPGEWNNLVIKAACNTSDVFDIAFVVDATGSMGDEINYLKSELTDVIRRVKTNNSDLELRLASVFYKDHGDDYLTRKSDFSTDPSQTMNFINKQYAGGGGDFPEAVDDALDVALNQLNWSPQARGRIMFLVLDAPPHQSEETQLKMQKLLLKAAAMGVRIIPVTGSGIDKGVEFLMRSMALTTNGTYVFLTNHSGVGGKHIEPSTDTYSVEKLNDLMVRVINQYAVSTGCKFVAPVQPKDSTQANRDTVLSQDTVKALTMTCFPNPTTGPVTIDVSEAGGVIYIADIHGRYLLRIDMTERKRLQEELGQLAAGTYFVKYKLENKEVTQKIVIVH